MKGLFGTLDPFHRADSYTGFAIQFATVPATRIELGSVSLCRIVIRFEVTRRMDLLHHQDRIKRRVECREDVSLF